MPRDVDFFVAKARLGEDFVAFPELEVERRLAQTVAWWREWAGRCRYDGPYREAVVRSALTVKALTDEHTGAYIAAATTSLPEELGGEHYHDEDGSVMPW